MVSVKEARKRLGEGKCLFCGKKLHHYEGMLGYESMRCDPCKVSIDHTGIHLDDF